MSNSTLKIENLCFKFNTVKHGNWTLDAINLNIKEGELIGLLGPSGCGKTTLLRLIAGFERPDKGIITLKNNVVCNSSFFVPPEKRGIGMVFQDFALFPHLNVWQNLIFGLRPNQDSTRAKWLFELLGLSDLSKRYPHELSGGQKQRLALARALAPGTSFVLLDEPFSNLDVEVRLLLRSELKNVLKNVSASGILVTHDPQEAFAICDRVAVMNKGMIHQYDSPINLVEKPLTSFVAKFALQRNILPIEIHKDKINTPIKDIIRPENIQNDSHEHLLIDEKSIQLIQDDLGNAIILGSEFYSDHWILKVKIDQKILRVWHPLGSYFEVGQKCFLSFRKGHKGLLLPGSVECVLS